MKFRKFGRWLSMPLFLSVLLSCNSVQEKKDNLQRIRGNEPTRISINEIENSYQFSELVENVEYVALKSINGGSTFLGNVDKIISYKNRYFILDTKTAKGLFCFDKLGNHLFSINKRGNGPGEFINISDFEIDYIEGNIKVYDEGNARLSVFNFDGEYLDLDYQISELGILPDCFSIIQNHNVWFNKNSCSNVGCHSLIITDKANVPFASGINNESLRGFSVDFGTPIARNKNELYVTQILNDTIYYLNQDLKLRTPLVIDYGKYSLSSKEKAELINNPHQIASFISASNKTPGPAYINFNDQFILITFLQNRSFVTLLINRQNNRYKVFRSYNYDDSKYIPAFVVTGNTNNSFIFYNENENIMALKKKIGKRKNHPYQSILDSLNTNTNGILAIAELKSF